jgi:hypothetical protein
MLNLQDSLWVLAVTYTVQNKSEEEVMEDAMILLSVAEEVI